MTKSGRCSVQEIRYRAGGHCGVRLLAMKIRTIFLLALGVVVGLIVAASVSLTHNGLSTRAQPSALETSIAAVMRKLAMPSSAHDAKNPVANTPEAIAPKCFLAGGQQTEIPGRLCLPIDQVENIVADFVATGHLSQLVAWEQV